MPRPRMNRRVRHQPPASFYKPQGVPVGQLRGVTLTLDGLEAIRLADAEGMEHEEAADMMGISRPTFSRLLAEARGTVARGLVNGWALRIEGGNYELADMQTPCDRGRHPCRRGTNSGRRGGCKESSNPPDARDAFGGGSADSAVEGAPRLPETPVA